MAVTVTLSYRKQNPVPQNGDCRQTPRLVGVMTAVIPVTLRSGPSTWIYPTLCRCAKPKFPGVHTFSRQVFPRSRPSLFSTAAKPNSEGRRSSMKQLYTLLVFGYSFDSYPW
jgi:hypothetical protein